MVIPSVTKAEEVLNPNLENKNETVYISNLGLEENHFEEIEPSGINEKMEISETQFLEIDSNFT